MRSIFVLLILVMIGLNGKGQSVTALPDSVLSQCCLEVTLLNGNVTTVDWVFVQYITRDGTGTKLFVEYAPNFGGIQWETQIRIQDDFDDVLERSKFIIIPFTVGSTDYGINRNWIANIEENTTTGGTWIYGRFGTPTKRKFSAVEDYETMKNRLLACRPRAIVVAENGLYTEGDTVRMGGFLIENTTITTEGYNWQMKDTLSSQQFGLTYDSPINGDTSAYFARRWGPWRQVMEMGQKRWMSEVRDTAGGDFSQVSHGFTNGSPIPYFIVESSNNAGTQYSQLILQKNFASWTMIDPFNSNYTMGFQTNSSTISIGANDANGPGNGPSMGAYAFGSTHYLYLKTDDVDNGTASVGQYLQLKNLGTGEVDFATIDLSAYLPIADTAAMLDPYIQGAGTINNLVKFTGTRVVANAAITENGSRVVMGLPMQFKSYPTVGLPTGSDNDIAENSTTGFLTRYKAGVWDNFGMHGETQTWTKRNTFQATTEPLRIGYDASKYASFVIGAQGSLGITVNGTNPDITLTATNGGAIHLIPGATGAVNMYTTSAGFALRNTTGTPTFFGFYNSSSTLRGLWGLTNSTNGLITGSVANDMAFRTQGGNLLFSTDSGNNSHMYIKSNGNVAIGIGSVNPQRTLHVLGEMRLTDLTTDTPTRIVGADGDGDFGQITFGTGITAPSGVLTIPTWKGELEAGNNFTISASSKTTTLKGDGNVFRTTTSAGARGSLMQNGAMLVAKTTAGRFGGNFFIQDTLGVVDNLFYIGQDDDASIQAFGAGPQITHTIQNTKLPGTFRWAYALRVDTSVTIPGLRIVQGDRYASTLNPVSHRFYAGLQATATISAYDFTSFASDGKMAFNINSAFNVRQGGKVYFAPDSTFSFDPSTDLLHITGTARITGSTGTPTTVVGRDGSGNISNLGLSGLSVIAGVLTATGSADGNGIYSSSATLANHTTRARLPDDGNLLFSQLFNSSADSMYLYFRNYGSGERAFGFGLTDTASTGYTRAEFSSDGSGEMNWALQTSGASGTTSVRSDAGSLSLITNGGGGISLNVTTNEYVSVTGYLAAKQEAYNEITSTSSPQTLSSQYSDNLINQGGAQASFTFEMPPSPEDGQICTLTYNNAISTLTLDGNRETIIGTAVTTAVAGSQRKFKFYSGIGWIKIY